MAEIKRVLVIFGELMGCCVRECHNGILKSLPRSAAMEAEAQPLITQLGLKKDDPAM